MAIAAIFDPGLVWRMPFEDRWSLSEGFIDV
jgi:hypothetical protein